MAATVIIAWLVAGLLPVQASGLEPKEIYERWAPAVVTVVGSRALGSGFVIPPSGFVVTNYHVVEGQDQLQVILLSGERRPVSSVVLEDRIRDLAVLSIDPTGLPRVILGDSSAVQPGERVVAIGTPQNLRHTVTEGIISQVRSLDGVSLLQTQTPISPGSSGGPLFNGQGAVIGIIAFKRIGGENLNFAVAVNELRNMLGEPIPAPPRLPVTSTPSVRPRSEPQGPQSGYTLQLWNGSSVPADAYEERGGSIIYERREGSVTITRSSVARIIRNADGSVVQITGAPPQAEPRPAPEPKIDVREILTRPRAPSTPQSGGTIPPAALSVPQGVCVGPSEDVSTAQWRILNLNLIRMDDGSRSAVIHVRGLQSADLPEWQIQRMMDEVIRSGRQITLVNPIPKGGGGLEANLCMDGRDIAEHPKLAPFRVEPRVSP